MSKRFISKLDSYALMIIALSAVFVSVWQVRLQRKHDKISVKPYLTWVKSMDDDGYISLRLKNKGFGPAFFTKGELQLSDTTFRDWRRGLLHQDDAIDIKQSSSMGRLTLLPGEQFLLVSAKGGTGLLQFKFKVYFKDAYEDEYEDTYTYSGMSFK